LRAGDRARMTAKLTQSKLVQQGPVDRRYRCFEAV